MIYSRHVNEKKEEQDDLLPYKINYINHVSSGDAKQDLQAALSCFEACLMQLKNEQPYVNEIYLGSDNAKCYKSPELMFLLNIIAKHYDIKIIYCVHAGVQDSKSALDGHFVKVMKYVNRFCNRGNDVITPIGLVKALRSNGGILNAVAELVGINRMVVDNLVHKFSSEITVLKNIGNHCESS